MSFTGTKKRSTAIHHAPREDVGAESFESHYETTSESSFGDRALWGYYERNSTYVTTQLKAALITLVGAFLFTGAVNLTKAIAVTATLVDGLAIGIGMGLAYYLFSTLGHGAGSGYEPPRHFLWCTISADILTLRGIGLIPGLIALVVSGLGAAASGGVLVGMGIGVVPTPNTANPSQMWAYHLLSLGTIVFAYIYTTYMGGGFAKEAERNHKAQKAVAMVMVVFTMLGFPAGSYCVDAVLYISGVIGACGTTGCPVNTPFTWAPAFYLLNGFLAALPALIVYGVLILLNGHSRIAIKVPVRGNRSGGFSEMDSELKDPRD